MKKILAVLLCVAVVIAGAIGYLAFDMSGDTSGKNLTEQEITIEIPKGSGANAIGKILKANGVIKNDLYFKLYVKKNPVEGLQYGTFTMKKGMAYEDIIKTLTVVQDKRQTVSVTIPEGSTVIKFAKLVEEAGLCSSQEFIDTVENTDWSAYRFYQYVKQDANKPFKMEGFLFPDTYEFFPEATPQQIAEKMVAHFDGMITDKMYEDIEKAGFDLQDIVTLASYVQEEAGDPANQGDVAAVFLNRLKPNSPHPKLESDVSYYYMREFIEPYLGVGRDESPIEMQNAINTYNCVGIPITPVSSPGIDAIMATIYPTKNSPYYFFLTDLTGKYYYAETYAQHEHNINAMKAVNAGVEKNGK
ncbi:MAG: endolytic transglycosylase MltG [Oscillospiraceae bacterium]